MYRILIADDERIERLVLYKTLHEHMADLCEIYQAENGREALEMFAEKQIQIAILDIEMPGINGIEAAEKMRAGDPNCCIIFLTAYDEFSYAKKAITVKAQDYLLKPYDEEELLTVLEEAIHQIEKNKRRSAADAQYMAQRRDSDSNDSLMDSGQLRISKVAESIEIFIKNHYREDISLQIVAAAMNYSEAYFSKLFKQCFSRNFTSYLTRFRIEEAKKLLASPTMNVKWVGEAVGYPDSNYFAKVFRRYTGCSPTEYRIRIYQQQAGEQI